MHGLMIGRNPISTITGNGKTLATFFGCFSSEELTQIFVSNLYADRNLCNTFYKINEKKILLPNRTDGKGSLISEYSTTKSNGVDVSSGCSSITNTLVRLLRTQLGVKVRDYMWKKKINVLLSDASSILETRKYDFIFYDVGNISSEYEFVIRLVEKYKIPLFIYISDDYIYGKNGKKSSERIRNIFERLVAKSSFVIVISEAMRELYVQHINADYVVAMNGCEAIAPLAKKKESIVKHIVYTGNVGIGRFKVLQNVGRAISTLKEQVDLKIFSSFSITNKMKNSIESTGRTRFCGTVYGDELRSAWENADILIHVESFKRKYKSILETAISTKISEYMCSERPILIVAPGYSESARFVERNNAGTVVYSEDKREIAEAIESMCKNYEAAVKRAENVRIWAIDELSKRAVSILVFKKIQLYCSKEEKAKNEDFIYHS